MVTIGTELSDIDELKEISDNHKNIFRTIGIHPENAHDHLQKFSVKEIKKIIFQNQSAAKVIGIGEIGLDYHTTDEYADEQKLLFTTQIEIANASHLPICIHSRAAESDTIEILKKYPDTVGIMHCFSGSREFAQKSLDLGFHISISGIVTFKKAAELQEIVKFVPLDRLLIETDAPFLAPTPFRGKINEPAYVSYTAQKISEILNLPPEKIAEQTSENFFKLFPKTKK